MKKIMVMTVVGMFAASGASYGATISTANIEKMIDAGLEAASDQAVKDQDKVRWGDLNGHQQTILKEIRKNQPKCTEAVNVGRYEIESVVDAWEYRINNYKYLVEAKANGEVYYYNVVVNRQLTLIEHKWNRQEFVLVYPMAKPAAEKAKRTIK